MWARPLMVDGGLGGFCQLTVELFKSYRKQHVKRRVASTAVVDPFDLRLLNLGRRGVRGR